jgi:hypothetical protein
MPEEIWPQYKIMIRTRKQGFSNDGREIILLPKTTT